MKYIDLARKVFDEEAKAIQNLINFLDISFNDAIELMLNTNGRIIVMGVGKSGLIGKKIAASLSSTGTPSFFVHPTEAYHGDLGMIKQEDILLIITNSGETDEVLRLIPVFKENKNRIISITGNPASTLAKYSDVHLNVHVDSEVCPLNLAPTTSSTAALVMGDALLVCLMSSKKCQISDFARFHPGGSLGRKILLKLKDVMVVDNLPIVELSTPMTDVIYAISNGMFGLTVVVNSEKEIEGLITDGDLRRKMLTLSSAIFDLKAVDVMNQTPFLVDENLFIGEAQELCIKNNINTLLVSKEKKMVGIVSYKMLYEN